MADEDDIFGDEDEKQSVPVALAVLRAKVRMLTYLVKHDLISRAEFAPVRLIAYGLMALIAGGLITAALENFFKR